MSHMTIDTSQNPPGPLGRPPEENAVIPPAITEKTATDTIYSAYSASSAPSDKPPAGMNWHARHLLTLPHSNSQQGLSSELLEAFSAMVQQINTSSVQTARSVTGWLDEIKQPSKLAQLLSSEEFEIALTHDLNTVKSAQQQLTMEKIEQTRSQNRQKMEENQVRLQESSAAVKEAKTAGLFSKLFGWISAVAMLIVGAVLVATSVGAVAGSLLISSGALSIVNMVMQQVAEAGLISPETMKTLGWVLLAAQIVVAIVSIVATFGAATPAVAGSLSQAAIQGIKLGAQVTTTTTGVATGAAATGNAAMQYTLLNKQAEVRLSAIELKEVQKQMDKLTEHFRQSMTTLQQIMQLLSEMLHARGKTLDTLLGNRHATI